MFTMCIVGKLQDNRYITKSCWNYVCPFDRYVGCVDLKSSFNKIENVETLQGFRSWSRLCRRIYVAYMSKPNTCKQNININKQNMLYSTLVYLFHLRMVSLLLSLYIATYNCVYSSMYTLLFFGVILSLNEIIVCLYCDEIIIKEEHKHTSAVEYKVLVSVNVAVINYICLHTIHLNR